MAALPVVVVLLSAGCTLSKPESPREADGTADGVVSLGTLLPPKVCPRILSVHKEAKGGVFEVAVRVEDWLDSPEEVTAILRVLVVREDLIREDAYRLRLLGPGGGGDVAEIGTYVVHPGSTIGMRWRWSDGKPGFRCIP